MATYGTPLCRSPVLCGRVRRTVPVDPFDNLADRRVELLLDVLALARDDLEDRIVQFGPAQHRK